MPKRKDILTFTGIVICSIILFNKFISNYYTFDTYKVISLGYEEYAMSTSFSEGRVFMGILMIIFNFLRIPIDIIIPITSISSILVSSGVVLLMYKLTVKEDGSKFQKILTLVLNYFLVFNFMYIDNLRFLENIVMALSLLFYTLAGIELVNNKKIPKSFILMFLGILCYQGTLNWFLMVVLFLSLLQHKDNYKEVVKDLIYSYIEAFISVVILFVYMKAYNALLHIQLNRFSNSILDNIINILSNLKIVIIYSSSLFPTCVFLIYTIIILISALANKNKKATINTTLLVMYSIIVCIPILLISNVAIESTGRIFFSIGACISLIILYLYNQEQTKVVEKYILPTIIFTYAIISIYNIFVITNCYKIGNEIDRKICNDITEQIYQYQKNNVQIKKVAITTPEKINVNQILEIDKEEKPLRKLPISYICTEHKVSNLLRYYNRVNVEDKEFNQDIKVKNSNIFNYVLIGETLYVSVK